MVDDKGDIDAIRVDMRELDAQILALLHRRARAARRAGELRRDDLPTLSGSDQGALREVVARSFGEMSSDSVRDIFEAIFAACAHLERALRVAFVGPEGGAAHATARNRFGRSSTLTACGSSAAALDEVSHKRAEFALAAFETSSGGPVEATVEALLSSDLRVVEIVDVRLDVHLMSRTGRLFDIQKVYLAGDRALSSRMLAELGREVTIAQAGTPAAAYQAAADDPGAAAVALETFGVQAGLQIIRRDVLDDAYSRIRFAVIGSRPAERALAERTAFAFRLQQGPDALVDVLRTLAERGVRLTQIHSLPSPGEPWSYLFLAEATGHFTDRRLVMAFEELKRLTRSLRLLGSYPDPGEERASS